MVQEYSHILLPEDGRLDSVNPPTLTANLGTINHTVLQYNNNDYAYWIVRPIALSSGIVYIDIDWYGNTAFAGDVVWEAYFAGITPNANTQDVETKTFGAINYVADAHLGTTIKRLMRATITCSAIDGVDSSKLLWIKIARDTGTAPVTDTLAGLANLALITLRYTV